MEAGNWHQVHEILATAFLIGGEDLEQKHGVYRSHFYSLFQMIEDRRLTFISETDVSTTKRNYYLCIVYYFNF